MWGFCEFSGFLRMCRISRNSEYLWEFPDAKSRPSQVDLALTWHSVGPDLASTWQVRADWVPSQSQVSETWP